MLYRKLVVWWQLSWLEKGWFVPTWLLLGLARSAVLVVPFRRIAPFFGHDVQGRAVTHLLVDRLQVSRARRIGRIIRLATRYTPWQSNCFAQAIVARIVLGLYGIPYTLYFGLARRDGQQIEAHAWVTAGRVPVTGGAGFDRYVVVGVFVSTPLLMRSDPQISCLHDEHGVPARQDRHSSQEL